MGPDSTGLPPTRNCWRAVSAPRDAGMVPLRRLSWTQSTWPAERLATGEEAQDGAGEVVGIEEQELEPRERAKRVGDVALSAFDERSSTRQRGIKKPVSKFGLWNFVQNHGLKHCFKLREKGKDGG